jgi:DNA-binding TFAR19-related protein (PDSD5 family)
VATLEWNMQQMLEKGKIDAKLNEKVLREILNTPG